MYLTHKHIFKHMNTFEMKGENTVHIQNEMKHQIVEILVPALKVKSIPQHCKKEPTLSCIKKIKSYNTCICLYRIYCD